MKSTQRLEGGRYRPLRDQDIKAIHETSMRVFSEVGIKVKNKEALALFASAGAKVSFNDHLFKMEPERIMDLISKAPEVIPLYGQRSEHTMEVGIIRFMPAQEGLRYIRIRRYFLNRSGKK